MISLHYAATSMAQQKYTIIEKIDAGGMAEVFKGKATSMRGFERLVAIKRVLPSLAKNNKFISMFLDEARLSLYLNHANVVQTFDIGTSEGASYFVVMEWVDGINLKAIMQVATERGFRLPREQAAFIIAEVCKGLNHAHNRKDPNDRPLNIVHRDISPPNVMMSREGEVKLVDFGLAKAASQVTITDPGIVKGKFSYLSPEAAYGKPVDGRADLFSAGIVLWEMLAGRRLFDGDTDLKTVELVRATSIPSLKKLNPDVEPQLEAIVRKALARDPRDRFQTAEAMGHEISRYLFENRLLVTSYDIAMLAKRAMQTRDDFSRVKPNTSGVARLEAVVQAEIGVFTSVEDLERLAFRSVSDEDDDAMERTIIANAEDPRGWADELGMDLGDDGDDTLGAHFGEPEHASNKAPHDLLGGDRPPTALKAPVTRPVRQVHIPAPPPPVPTNVVPPRPPGGHDVADRQRRTEMAAESALRARQGSPPQTISRNQARVVAALGVVASAAVAVWYFFIR